MSVGTLGDGPSVHVSVGPVTHAGWLFVASLLLARLTLRRHGRCTIAIAIHSAYNGTVFAGLVLAALRRW